MAIIDPKAKPELSRCKVQVRHYKWKKQLAGSIRKGKALYVKAGRRDIQVNNAMCYHVI